MDTQTWVLLAVIAGLIAELVYVRRQLSRPMANLTEWMKKVHAGDGARAPDLPPRGMLAPLAREAAMLAREFSDAKSAAQEEASLRQKGDSLWTAERLREHVKTALDGRTLLVVANREPYRHLRRDGQIVVETPASGLVTGLEPVLRACGGTWVADGDGDADRETADAQGRLKVPPGQAQYVLRRVWLTPEEEDGYYNGFSNEGLWPLCHIAYTRPVFRPEDWALYRAVNEKFAVAALEEIAGLREPFLLIQDYHFTLLPRLIKARRPDARIALFWHIPWPSPEAFGICPWQADLLKGMLGADLIGFHTQWHCNNFLETVDRALDCRIDRERFAVRRGQRVTLVKPFPISVEFPRAAARPKDERETQRRELLASLGVAADFVAVGVDRVDYTKGMVERFRGLERFLEKYPRYQGRTTLLQIGAPSRMHIPAYRRLNDEVEAEAKRINARFPSASCPPIVLLRRQHNRGEITRYYRSADLCLVTPLHDGMNLVAKEFVASRDDDGGALILSRFTGASRELHDALLVNPYDVDEVAEAIRAGLEMDPEERALKMSRLRRTVKEYNIYRWAADLITQLSAVRIGAEAGV